MHAPRKTLPRHHAYFYHGLLARNSHPISYCAAGSQAVSGRPRCSLGDTIPSCPQQVRRRRSSLRVTRSSGDFPHSARRVMSHAG
ncbi:MAG: hypothetical protein V3T81_02050 [Thermoanaerobaculia bacterium]